MNTSSKENMRRPGAYDPDFAGSGIFTFDSDVYGELEISGVTSTSDAKIVIVGHVRQGEGGRYAVIRLNKDGTPDSLFGDSPTGMVTGVFKEDALASFAGFVTVDENDKILVSGYYHYGGQAYVVTHPSLTRYMPDGTLDLSFGDQGVVYLEFPPPNRPPALKLPSTNVESNEYSPRLQRLELLSYRATPLANGKILLTGLINEPENPFFDVYFSILARLNADGSFDVEFNGKGYIHLGLTNNFVDSHVPLPDGKILIGGHINRSPNTQYLGFVGRYLEGGTPDLSFGTNGYVYLPEVLGTGNIRAMALHRDGKIIVGGNVGPRMSGILFSLTPQGHADPDFNGGNPLAIALGNTDDRFEIRRELLVEGDGVILLGYTVSGVTGSRGMGLARYFLDGTADTRFGDGGWWQYRAGEVYCLARLTDGNMAATGSFYNPDTSRSFFVARFLGQ